MKIASVASVKAKFSGYIKASKSGPIVVTKNGKPVAVRVADSN
jgi:prevent-host-death family protein